MKKTLESAVLAVCILAVCITALSLSPPAFADDNDQNHGVVDTGRGEYTTPYSPLTDWLNENEDFSHTHPVYIPEREDFSKGYGIDLLTYKGEEDSNISYLMTEYRYNKTYDEHVVYTVVGVNGPQVFDAIKGWFR